MKKYLDIPPVWALLFAVLAWLIAIFVPIYEFNVSNWFVGVLVGAGVYLIIWSAVWFRRKDTSIEPRQTPKTLVVEGPYKINRNPMYSGLTIILLGTAIWLGELSAIIPVICFPILLTLKFVKNEEYAIREKFGKEADEYFKNTRRW